MTTGDRLSHTLLSVERHKRRTPKAHIIFMKMGFTSMWKLSSFINSSRSDVDISRMEQARDLAFESSSNKSCLFRCFSVRCFTRCERFSWICDSSDSEKFYGVNGKCKFICKEYRLTIYLPFDIIIDNYL